MGLSQDGITCLVFAARYAHSRNTTAAYVVVDEILRKWDHIPGPDRIQLCKEAKNEATYNFDQWSRLYEKLERE